jgi:hypothetical protein
VCAAVIPNWSGLEGENKTSAGKFTQTLLWISWKSNTFL